MTPGRIVALVRAALCAAILGSAILENDYRHAGDPAFCGITSACLRLRRSEAGMRFAEWLAPYHLTLPQLGLLGFVALLAISFVVKTRTYLQAFVALTTFAGAAALYLIVVQAQLHTFCPYCMVVDTSTLIAAMASLVLLWVLRSGREIEPDLVSSSSAPVTFVWGLAAAIATAAPFYWADHPRVPPLPKVIADMQEPGKLTVVSITDFECPFCRKAHPALTKLHERPDVAFKRVMAPLPFHPGALPAAAAYLCAPPEQADAFADALYTAKEGDLTPDGVLEIAQGIGIDPAPIKTCMFSDETSERLEKDRAVFDAIGGEGLPTTFVGRYEIVGLDPPKLERAVASVKSPPFELPLPLLFVLVGGVTFAAFAFTWRRGGRADTLS